MHCNRKQLLYDILSSFFPFQPSSSVFSSQFLTPPSLRLLTVFILSVISSLLHHAAQLYLLMHISPYSMNILIRCCCWDPFLYGASNLYSWPRMHILRCVMIEEPCPTTRVDGWNNICYVCISWNEPVLRIQDDTLTRMQEKKYWICVWLTVFFDHLVTQILCRIDVQWWILDVEGEAVEGEQNLLQQDLGVMSIHYYVYIMLCVTSISATC